MNGLFKGMILAATLTIQAVALASPILTVEIKFRGKDGALPAGGVVSGPNGSFYGVTTGGGAYDSGTIFRSTPGRGFTVIHDFDPPVDGVAPIDPPILSADGRLYGTTPSGGPNLGGTIFRTGLDGSGFELLYAFTFTGTYDVFLKPGFLALGADGTLYGTVQDGPEGNGGLFALSRSGAFTVLHTFKADGSEGATPSSLIMASDGTLWGTTYESGTYGLGSVWHFDMGGTFSVVHQFKPEEGGAPLGPLLQTADGSFFGTASQFGPHNSGTVFKMTPQGRLRILYAFGTTPNDGSGPLNLVLTADGLLHGTTANGGKKGGKGTVFKLTQSGQLTTLHAFGAFFTKGETPGPGSIAVGNDGSVYGNCTEGGFTNERYPSGMGTLYRVTP